ncbi:MAG: SusD/RagB family nutrient-binding outer membrane lipoprotein [Cyclobacteriaceae bacterium]
MKTIRKKISTAWMSGLILAFLIGCTGKFEDYNKDVTGIYTKDLAADYNILSTPIQQMQLKIYDYNPAWEFQVAQNLNADIYSGYMMTPDLTGNNNQNYALTDGWNLFAWSTPYDNVMRAAHTVLPIAKSLGSNDYYSWAKILRVAGMHRVTDIYGPIVFSKYGVINADGSIDYDSQQDVYNQFFADLDSAINILTPLAQSGSQSFAKADLVYSGDVKSWVKYANTLRLRLAMRISSVDPNLAKTQGEAALANSVGLLSSGADDNCIVNIGHYRPPFKYHHILGRHSLGSTNGIIYGGI